MTKSTSNSQSFRDGQSPARNEPPDVTFVGVISHDNRLNHISVPEEFQNHPLVSNKHFYTIPRQLLRAVSPSESKDTFESDDQLLRLEIELARIAGDHDVIIGLWNNKPINSNLLFSNPVTRELLPDVDQLSEAEIVEKLAVINNRLLGFHEISCAYAGWLMQNPVFRSEFDALTSTHGQAINQWGTEIVGLPIPTGHPAEDLKPTGEPGWSDYEVDVLQFCIRWRLQGLAGPRIPVPMRPMMSGQFPVSILQQLMRAGGVFNWPDTFPLYARDQLRDLIADALRSTSSSDHLQEWQQIIATSNKAKNQFSAFERQFRFQHFWKLLRERHPTAFDRRLNKLEQSFAAYFGVSEATIHNDRDTL
jgi:hypothetical protein